MVGNSWKILINWPADQLINYPVHVIIYLLLTHASLKLLNFYRVGKKSTYEKSTYVNRSVEDDEDSDPCIVLSPVMKVLYLNFLFC